jgi:hypothetical protein
MGRTTTAILFVAGGVFAAGAGCGTTDSSDPGESCPPTLPPTTLGCAFEGTECGYATPTNACGASDCYCHNETWSCEATCIVGDASTSADTGPDADGPAACVAAGGECLVGGLRSDCAVVGPQDCNPDRNPGGSYCCLQKASVADAATDGGGSDAEACAPSGCATACPAGTHDVSSVVNGCTVWQCCISDDGAGPDAATDAAADASAE